MLDLNLCTAQNTSDKSYGSGIASENAFFFEAQLLYNEVKLVLLFLALKGKSHVLSLLVLFLSNITAIPELPRNVRTTSELWQCVIGQCVNFWFVYGG